MKALAASFSPTLDTTKDSAEQSEVPNIGSSAVLCEQLWTIEKGTCLSIMTRPARVPTSIVDARKTFSSQRRTKQRAICSNPTRRPGPLPNRTQHLALRVVATTASPTCVFMTSTHALWKQRLRISVLTTPESWTGCDEGNALRRTPHTSLKRGR